MKKMKLDDWKVRLQEILAGWRDIRFNSPFIAVWVFLKATALGVLADLLIDLKRPVQDVIAWFFSGEPVKVDLTITNNTVTTLQTTVADSLGYVFQDKTVVDTVSFSVQTMTDTVLNVVTSRVPLSEAVIASPEWGINFPFWIIAFAAGKMSTRVSSLAGHILGLVLLGCALIPEFAYYESLGQFIPLVVGKCALYGFAAYLTSPDRSLIQRGSARNRANGHFVLSLMISKSEVDQIQELLRKAIEKYSNTQISDLVVNPKLDKETRRSQAVATIVGRRAHLPAVRTALLEVFRSRNPVATLIQTIPD